MIRSIIRRLEGQISSLTETMKSHGNHFKTESDKLFNLVTKKVLPQKSKEVNFWSTLSNRNLQTWRTNLKKLKVKTRSEGNIVELSADRALFGRMIIVDRSRPEIDLLETIGIVRCTPIAIRPRWHHASRIQEV